MTYIKTFLSVIVDAIPYLVCPVLKVPGITCSTKLRVGSCWRNEGEEICDEGGESYRWGFQPVYYIGIECEALLTSIVMCHHCTSQRKKAILSVSVCLFARHWLIDLNKYHASVQTANDITSLDDGIFMQTITCL